MKYLKLRVARLGVCILLFFSMIGNTVYGQFDLKGSVVDNSGEPVKFANILLLDSRGVLEYEQLTGQDGTFLFDLGKGEYTLIVLGFREWFVRLNIKEDTELGELVFSQENFLLKDARKNTRDKILEDLKPLFSNTDIPYFIEKTPKE